MSESFFKPGPKLKKSGLLFFQQRTKKHSQMFFQSKSSTAYLGHDVFLCIPMRHTIVIFSPVYIYLLEILFSFYNRNNTLLLLLLLLLLLSSKYYSLVMHEEAISYAVSKKVIGRQFFNNPFNLPSLVKHVPC